MQFGFTPLFFQRPEHGLGKPRAFDRVAGVGGEKDMERAGGPAKLLAAGLLVHRLEPVEVNPAGEDEDQRRGEGRGAK